MNHKDNSDSTDIGDYMKVFACTAVMMQSVLSLVLTTDPDHNTQIIIGILYNFVKFTAPAFIFGILYTTTRTTNQNHWSNYDKFFRKHWSALFVPTIWWTLTYLMIFPNVQQVNHFNSFGSFIWQFINGNAAPHLWYNTMMLQFILLMPFFWSLAHWVKNNIGHTIFTIMVTIIVFAIWIKFYDMQVFHGPHQQNWYLLDRFFFSFVIYGIFGVLAWMSRDKFEALIQKTLPISLILFCISFYWTNKELFNFGYPIKLTNAPYYKFSMTLYSLIIISLIAALAIYQLRKHSQTLPFFHFLAIYAYRAYLSNVFWLQIIWKLFGSTLSTANPLLAIISCYLLTWGLSFTSAYIFHVLWVKTKSIINKIGFRLPIE